MPQIKLPLALFLCCFGSSLVAWAETSWAETPPRPSVFVTSVTVVEGDSGQTTFTAQVSLSNVLTATTVKVTATAGTADESDYVFTPVELTLTAGGGPQTVTGYIVGDTRPEEDEYFTLSASPVGSSQAYAGFGRVAITDNDQALASQLHAEGATVTEGDQGTTWAEVRVKLEPPTTNTVTVTYQTLDGTAVAGADYQAASGTVTFAPSEVSKTIRVGIINETSLEPDESFFVELSNPDMALLGTPRAEVVIATNDDPVHATLADVTVDEGNDGLKVVPITITFGRALPNQAKVEVAVVGAGAIAGKDFNPFSDTLLVPAGATTMTFNLEVLADTTPECDEGLFIRYAASYTGDETGKTAKVLLRNDDGTVDGCPDPFAPPAPPKGPGDGGLDAAPDGAMPRVAEPGWDGGPLAYPDAAVSTPPVEPAWDGGPLAHPDAAVPTPPVEPAWDGGSPAYVADSGCSCSLGSTSRQAGFGSLVLAGLLALLRRRQKRNSYRSHAT